MKKFFYKRGVSLVEVLIASSIILIFVVALVSVHNIYKQLASSNSSAVKSVFLAEEGLEVVKLLRDASWATKIAPLALNTSYYLVFQNGSWAATTTASLIDGIERRVVFNSVQRDASGNIIAAGGSLDTGTRLVTVSVSWPSKTSTTTQALSAYISNIFSN